MLSVLERMREQIEDHHLVHEHEGPREQRLPEAGIPLPVIGIRGDDDFGPRQLSQILPVEVAPALAVADGANQHLILRVLTRFCEILRPFDRPPPNSLVRIPPAAKHVGHHERTLAVDVAVDLRLGPAVRERQDGRVLRAPPLINAVDALDQAPLEVSDFVFQMSAELMDRASVRVIQQDDVMRVARGPLRLEPRPGGDPDDDVRFVGGADHDCIGVIVPPLVVVQYLAEFAVRPIVPQVDFVHRPEGIVDEAERGAVGRGERSTLFDQAEQVGRLPRDPRELVRPALRLLQVARVGSLGARNASKEGMVAAQRDYRAVAEEGVIVAQVQVIPRPRGQEEPFAGVLVGVRATRRVLEELQLQQQRDANEEGQQQQRCASARPVPAEGFRRHPRPLRSY
ncbi:hypothetical protein ACHAWF_004331 [Thalassiosira exigua]